MTEVSGLSGGEAVNEPVADLSLPGSPSSSFLPSLSHLSTSPAAQPRGKSTLSLAQSLGPRQQPGPISSHQLPPAPTSSHQLPSAPTSSYQLPPAWCQSCKRPWRFPTQATSAQRLKQQMHWRRHDR